jgi:hypothetical protein
MAALVKADLSTATSALTATELQNTVTAALSRLEALGINTGLLAQLESIPFTVATLPPGVLAEVEAGQVLVSASGGGSGWFVGSNAEFTVGAPSSPLLAIAGSAASAKEDLQSAVFKELSALASGGDGLLTTTELPDGQRTDLLDTVFAGMV